MYGYIDALSLNPVRTVSIPNYLCGAQNNQINWHQPEIDRVDMKPFQILIGNREWM